MAADQTLKAQLDLERGLQRPIRAGHVYSTDLSACVAECAARFEGR